MLALAKVDEAVQVQGCSPLDESDRHGDRSPAHGRGEPMLGDGVRPQPPEREKTTSARRWHSPAPEKASGGGCGAVPTTGVG